MFMSPCEESEQRTLLLDFLLKTTQASNSQVESAVRIKVRAKKELKYMEFFANNLMCCDSQLWKTTDSKGVKLANIKSCNTKLNPSTLRGN